VGFASCALGLATDHAGAGAPRARRHLTRGRVELSHPPTDIANVSGVIPVGNLNPGGGHLLAVNHMYLGYPFPATGGAYSYPVYAMGDGAVVMVIRTEVAGMADADWEVFVSHGSGVTSYFIHIHGISTRLQHVIAATPDAAWIAVGQVGRLLLLGARGAPAPLAVTAGEQIGITKSYSHNWDVGVIDSHVSTAFAGQGPRRYPTFADYVQLLGIDAPSPYPGQQTINAVCFINYLKSDIRDAWFNLLTSTPKTCGRPGWDLPGKLRGAWFNPSLDTASPPPLFELESGAISIIPDNQAPTANVQIGIASGNHFAALDPDRRYLQLGSPFRIPINTASQARINPDPALVGPSTGTVCYDLLYGSDAGPRYNTILFHMVSETSVAIKFDPIAFGGPQCAAIPLGEPDSTWTTTYVR